MKWNLDSWQLTCSRDLAVSVKVCRKARVLLQARPQASWAVSHSSHSTLCKEGEGGGGGVHEMMSRSFHAVGEGTLKRKPNWHCSQWDALELKESQQ